MNLLAVEYIQTFPDSTLLYAKMAVENSKKIEWEKGLGNSYHNMGYAYYMLGNFDTTLFYWEKALAIREKQNNKKDVSASLSNIAAVYLYQGNFLKALDYNFKAVKTDEEIGNKNGLETSLNNIGNIYKYQGDYKKAIEYYSKALKLNEETGNKNYLSALLSNMGIALKNQNEYDKALEYFFKALKINEELGNKNNVATILGNIGVVYKNKNNYQKSIEYLLKALELSKELQSKNQILAWLGNIGSIYIKQKKFDAAEIYLQEAIALSIDIGALNEQMQIENSLSELYVAKGDYKKGYDFFYAYSNSKDSLLSADKNKQIAEMQTKYETEKKQQENEMLTKENEIKSLEIEQQKTKQIFTFVGFGFVFLLGFLVFNRIRLKQKNKILVEKELRASAVFQAQEKEKVHLSKELHDGLGPLLSLIKLNVSSLETNSRNQKIISEIKDLASEGMKEVRTISHALMPSLLEKKGLEATLNDFVEQINQTNTLNAKLAIKLSSKLVTETEINIYRIVQEAVNNALKHAKATQISIKIIENKEQLELTVSDNGLGLDVAKISAGNGLNNIYQRIDFLKGKIKLDSTKEKGTSLSIFIPIKKHQNV